MSKIKHVAVIGAGPAGLCTLRHLLHSNTNSNVSIKPVVFEQNNVLGGTWVYEDVDKEKKQEVFSSIYANLKTNLPKQVMMYPDFPHPDHVPTYMHHSLVRKYLDDYAGHFKLKKHIQFNTDVESVTPILETGTDILSNRFIKWNVKSKQKCGNDNVGEEYDAVVVCNGHYSVPAYPTIDGLENFNRTILHSHYYRHPSDYQGRDVLLLGSGPSALDIMVELSTHCRTVYISHRRSEKIKSALPENVKEYPNISFVDVDGKFVFEDSSTAIVDTFIPCTGYTLNFPFLTEDCGINIEDNNITDLYKHIFNIMYPSLSFVGLTWQNTPLPSMYQQCHYITKVISEEKYLPSFDDMLNDTNEERRERLQSGEPWRYFHRMADRQWAYNRELAFLGDNEVNPPVIENLYKYAMKIRNENLWLYKNKEYKAINDSEFDDIS